MSKQAEMVLNYMRRFGSITQLDALQQLSVMRLSARIHELRSHGYAIESIREQGVNRFGTKYKICRYSLVRGGHAEA